MRHGLVVAISVLSPLLPFVPSANRDRPGQEHTLGDRVNSGGRGQAQPVVIQVDSFMKRAAEYGQFNGAILVIDSGQRVYERAFGEANREWHVPNTVNTRFEIASMTKAMRLIERTATGIVPRGTYAAGDGEREYHRQLSILRELLPTTPGDSANPGRRQ